MEHDGQLIDPGRSREEVGNRKRKREGDLHASLGIKKTNVNGYEDVKFGFGV
jgi:hypothetical protein